MKTGEKITLAVLGTGLVAGAAYLLSGKGKSSDSTGLELSLYDSNGVRVGANVGASFSGGVYDGQSYTLRCIVTNNSTYLGKATPVLINLVAIVAQVPSGSTGQQLINSTVPISIDASSTVNHDIIIPALSVGSNGGTLNASINIQTPNNVTVLANKFQSWPIVSAQIQYVIGLTLNPQ
jgi:hypothetical protein